MGTKTFKNEILVRDKRIAFLEELGGIIEKKEVPKEEILSLLNDKLLEEAQELHEAIKIGNDKDIIKEICDVMAVLDGLKSYLNINNEEVINKKEDLKERLGEYEEGAYIKTIEIDENNSLIDYYLERPDKYPQIDKVKG